MYGFVVPPRASWCVLEGYGWTFEDGVAAEETMQMQVYGETEEELQVRMPCFMAQCLEV